MRPDMVSVSKWPTMPRFNEGAVFLGSARNPTRVAFIRFSLILSLLIWPLHAMAQDAYEVRAKALYSQLRCVVCQNQSILDSDADVARDLRQIVREEIAAGRTDDEIRSFLVERYGEFILLKPLFRWHTALLWLAPVMLLAIGAIMAWRSVANRRRMGTALPLSAEEERRVAALLDQHEESSSKPSG